MPVWSWGRYVCVREKVCVCVCEWEREKRVRVGERVSVCVELAGGRYVCDRDIK